MLFHNILNPVRAQGKKQPYLPTTRRATWSKGERQAIGLLRSWGGQSRNTAEAEAGVRSSSRSD